MGDDDIYGSTLHSAQWCAQKPQQTLPPLQQNCMKKCVMKMVIPQQSGRDT
jgi:hypothetical protein